MIKITNATTDKIIIDYLYVFLQSIIEDINIYFFKGVGLKHLQKTDLKNLKIPLPPLNIQKDIVKECSLIDDDVEKANENIKANKLKINNELKNIKGDVIKLGEIGKIKMCKRIFKEQTTGTGDIPFYKIGTFGKTPNAFIKQELFDEYKSKFSYPKKGDILISTSGTIGRIVVFNGKPAYFQDSNIVWIDNNEKIISNSYLNLVYKNINWLPSTGTTIARLYNKIIEETKITIPSFKIQKEIVSKIQKLEIQINESKKVLDSASDKKKDILKKYL
jgi:type I restriction enzyme S subunit